ncbi:hypothetical protein LXL04_033713 [Taraxacum kok-saghyz]
MKNTQGSWFKRERENKRGALINSSGIFVIMRPPDHHLHPPDHHLHPPPDHHRTTAGPPPDHRRTTAGPPPDHRRCTTCTHRHIGPLMHHRRTTAVPLPEIINDYYISEIRMTLIYDADAEADEEMLTLMSIWYLLTPDPLFFLRSDTFKLRSVRSITKGSTSTATMYHVTGEAPGTAGYVHITDIKGGKVRFTPEDNPSQTDTTYVKSILEMPYNISVIQISAILQSPEAEAPTAAPDLNLTSLLQRDGCQAFYDLLTSSGAIGTFLSSADGGVTVFCPGDDAIAAFAPKYKNLTASEKTSLLLYHGVPVYNSMGMLRSSNGLMNTLATKGAKKKYDFTVQNDGNDVTLKTKVMKATISGTVVDEEPVAIYTICLITKTPPCWVKG